jgi:hypothetical protein
MLQMIWSLIHDLPVAFVHDWKYYLKGRIITLDNISCLPQSTMQIKGMKKTYFDDSILVTGMQYHWLQWLIRLISFS